MSQELNSEEKARQTIDERLENQGWNEIEETVGTGYCRKIIGLIFEYGRYCSLR